MIFDSLLAFSGGLSAAGATIGQAVTGTGNVLSTNVVDLGNAKDIDQGQGIPILIQALVDTVGGTSIEFQVVTADDAGLTTNVRVVVSSGPTPIASLTAGARDIMLAKSYPSKDTARRFLGIRYVLVGSVTTASFLAAVVTDADLGRPINYKSNFAIL